MDDVQGPTTTASESFFWSCVTLDDKCPFFSKTDPRLYYFGFGVIGLYAAFFIMLLADLKFWWSINDFQRQIDYYVELVRRKVRIVQMDQERLSSAQELTDKQLRRSHESQRVVTALRAAVCRDDPGLFNYLMSRASSKKNPEFVNVSSFNHKII